MASFDFHPTYQKYKEQLPPYVLQRIADQITKKYQINENNADVHHLFQKYYTQYQKKKQYDKVYFGSAKTNLKRSSFNLRMKMQC